MIGVDTNVLLRLLIIDDSRQNAAAANFFAQRSIDDPAYISLIVIAELAWALRKKYKFENAELIRTIEGLLASTDVVLERRDILERAIGGLPSSKIDLSDLLIDALDREARCGSTVTFDIEAAKRIPGMALLA